MESVSLELHRAVVAQNGSAFDVLREAHDILDGIIGPDGRKIAARLQDVAADRATNAALARRVQELEAALDKAADELDATKAERDAYRSQFWDKALPDLAKMRAERDAKHAAFNVMDGCYKQAMAERDSETRWAHYYFTAWQTARQSRARLVRLVRELQDWRTLAYKYHRICLRAETERDAARAWAAAWKRAAHMHREYQDTFGYVGASVSANRRALRALRAAEAMERR